MTQEALKLALEAQSSIEFIKYWANAYSNPESGPHFHGHGMVSRLLTEYANLVEALSENAMQEVQRLGQEIEQNSMSDEMLQAITDPENQPSQYGTVTLDYHFEKIKKWEDLFERLSNKVLQQPDQEPVAWISTSPARMIHWTSDKPAYGDDWIPLYTKEQL